MATAVLVIIVVLSVVAAVVLLWVITRKKATEQRACPRCRNAMLPSWTNCMFCGWAPVARLDFILGPLAGHSVDLAGDVCTLGSVAGNTIVLADPAVSRKHAGIRRGMDGMYELADLGSTNGIYVNGHRVPKKVLEEGDVIRVGNSELIFRRA
jgi:hypothetical protein